jgi:hypothetical protein
MRVGGETPKRNDRAITLERLVRHRTIRGARIWTCGCVLRVDVLVGRGNAGGVVREAEAAMKVGFQAERCFIGEVEVVAVVVTVGVDVRISPKGDFALLAAEVCERH